MQNATEYIQPLSIWGPNLNIEIETTAKNKECDEKWMKNGGRRMGRTGTEPTEWLVGILV